MKTDNNIPFECDVRNTKDNICVLAHDSIIKHDEKEIKINKYTYQELCDMLGNDAPARLEKVLEYNNGKVAIVVDAKEAHIFYSKYRENLAKLLNRYSSIGEILLQSFNPFFMLSMRSHLKDVLTGQLICRGKTILDSFKAPKSIAYTYERIISLICFISRTDIINMENHSEPKWKKRTKYFTSKNANLNIIAKREYLQDKIENSKIKLNNILDKMQLRLVEMAYKLTKKPVLTFTIQDKSEFDLMENLYIVNYITDFSKLGIEEYIRKIKKKYQDNNHEK